MVTTGLPPHLFVTPVLMSTSFPHRELPTNRSFCFRLLAPLQGSRSGYRSHGTRAVSDPPRG